MSTWHRRGLRLLVAAGLAAGIGCTTIRTKFYDFDETGTRDVRCLKGLPVTLQVPTHLKLQVIETHYFVKNQDMKTAQTVPYVLLASEKPARGLSYDFITVKELYAVDFKRPLSGIQDLKMSLKDQYFTKIQNDVTDNSLQSIANLVQAAAAALPVRLPIKGVEDPSQGVDPTAPVAIPRVVVCEVFDLRTPGIEARIQAFLDQYVNQCTPQCPRSAAPAPAPLTPVVPTAFR
jgi:hypothetical protein